MKRNLFVQFATIN